MRSSRGSSSWVFARSEYYTFCQIGVGDGAGPKTGDTKPMLIHKYTKDFIWLLCLIAPIALLGWRDATAGNLKRPTGCSETTNLYAIYLIPTGPSYQKALLYLEKEHTYLKKEVKNKLWGAPDVPLHITLADFAQSQNDSDHRKHCPHHPKGKHLRISAILKDVGTKTNHGFHIPASKWAPETIAGKRETNVYAYRISGESKTLDSILKDTNKLHQSSGEPRKVRDLHVTFQNSKVVGSKHKKAMKHFLGILHWKICEVKVVGSANYNQGAPGSELTTVGDCLYPK